MGKNAAISFSSSRSGSTTGVCWDLVGLALIGWEETAWASINASSAFSASALLDFNISKINYNSREQKINHGLDWIGLDWNGA
jgi:hypothetical protein